MHLGLAGWVRNRGDGTVEAEFEGERDTLQQMLNWCRNGPSFASVDAIEEDWDSGPAKHDGFHVRG
jgi:acylphosphatase